MEKAQSAPVRVLLTGSQGFIGRATWDELERQGYEVIDFDLATGKSLTDPSCYHGLEYEAVIHLAAISSTPWAAHDPQKAFDYNVYGTWLLMKDAVAKGVNRFVYASSSRVLDNMWDNAYVTSKALEEEVAWFFLDHMKVMGLRYTSVYGPEGFHRHWTLNILLQIIKASLEGTEIDIYGDGLQLRNFVHVEDVARANVAAICALSSPESPSDFCDVGGNFTVSLKGAIDMVERITGKKINASYTGQYPSDYMMKQEADLGRTYKLIGHQPIKDLYEGISECVRLYLQADSMSE